METRDHFVGRLLGEQYKRTFKTDNYVCIPPALLITDERGDTWSIGSDYIQDGQRFYWGVIRNDKHMDEHAERIEYKAGRVRIYTTLGPKVWNGRTFI
jgi:hypothetical protein